MKRILHILVSIFFLIYLWNCAKTGSPAGGPRDKTPPVAVKSKPLNGSLNFKGRQVEITFDEYIKPEGMSEEMVISPPLEERIETRMKGKTLVIDMQEALRENATYTLSFGESIKDLNEGNVLNNYEFIFSTGNYLDSLAVIGTVLQAYDLKPLEEDVHILLYTHLNDSAPYLEIPDYVCKANEKGAFLINNIRPATYRLFVLQDQNRNLKYDVPEEQIGFLDTLIILSEGIFESIDKGSIEPPDTAFSDSGLFSIRDSAVFSMEDTLLVPSGDSITLYDLARYSVMVDVFSFREDNEPQYLIDNKRDDRWKLTFLFNREVKDTVILEPLNFRPMKDWFLLEEHIMKDTFDYWITDSLIFNLDSLEIIARYQVTDSLMNYVDFEDTLKFIFREPVQSTRRRKSSEDTKEKENLDLVLNIGKGQNLDIFRDIILTAKHPVFKTDTSKIRFTYRKDTIDFTAAYSLVQDTMHIRKYCLSTKWLEETRYDLHLYPGAMEDIYGLTNDTIKVNFRTRHSDYYGKILVNLTGVDVSTIIQVLDSKGNLVKESSSDTDQIVEFPFLKPGTYTLKSIRDVNKNGRWDTGNYLKGIQPETVSFYKESINIRSNFHYEMNWDLSR